MELPSHPDADDQKPATAVSWPTVLVVAVVVVVLAMFVILHLASGGGPANH